MRNIMSISNLFSACAPNCKLCTSLGAGKCDANQCDVGFKVGTTDTCIGKGDFDNLCRAYAFSCITIVLTIIQIIVASFHKLDLYTKIFDNRNSYKSATHAHVALSFSISTSEYAPLLQWPSGIILFI